VFLWRIKAFRATFKVVAAFLAMSDEDRKTRTFNYAAGRLLLNDFIPDRAVEAARRGDTEAARETEPGCDTEAPHETEPAPAKEGGDTEAAASGAASKGHKIAERESRIEPEDFKLELWACPICLYHLVQTVLAGGNYTSSLVYEAAPPFIDGPQKRGWIPEKDQFAEIYD
jgi:hypothetical protein